MNLAQVVKYALSPPLEIGKGPMRPDQQFMRLAARYDAGLMAVRGWVIIPSQPSLTIWAPGATDRAMMSRSVRRAVGDLRQTDAAGLALFGKFHRADDQDPAHRAAPALPAASRIVFRAERNLRLVNLDQRLQRAAAGINHRPAQLVEQEPGGLVAAQPALRLKLQRRHAIKMAGKNVGSKESGLQRKVAGLQDGSRRH